MYVYPPRPMKYQCLWNTHVFQWNSNAKYVYTKCNSNGTPLLAKLHSAVRRYRTVPCALDTGIHSLYMFSLPYDATSLSILPAILSRTMPSWGSGIVLEISRFRDYPGNPGVLRFETQNFCISGFRLLYGTVITTSDVRIRIRLRTVLVRTYRNTVVRYRYRYRTVRYRTVRLPFV